MTADLFKSKKMLLYDWIKRRNGRAKTSEIIYEWGRVNMTTRADRYARDLAVEGKLRRMPEQKKIRIYGNLKESVWEIPNWASKPIPQMGVSLQSNSKYEEGR